jgi:hypothetical protein
VDGLNCAVENIKQIPLLTKLDYSLSSNNDDEESKGEADEEEYDCGMDFLNELQTVLE